VRQEKCFPLFPENAANHRNQAGTVISSLRRLPVSFLYNLINTEAPESPDALQTLGWQDYCCD
jgi:hypothetical protein